MNMIAIMLAALQPPITAEQRLQSPYLACAAEEADRSFTSSATIAEIQNAALARCEQFLERNVENSLAAVLRGSSETWSDDALAQGRNRLRTKLREGLLKVVENRVSAQRLEAAVGLGR